MLLHTGSPIHESVLGTVVSLGRLSQFAAVRQPPRGAPELRNLDFIGPCLFYLLLSPELFSPFGLHLDVKDHCSALFAGRSLAVCKQLCSKEHIL